MAKFNANAAANIDQDTVEQDGQQYPLIMFRNGNPILKKSGGVGYRGGWFITADGSVDMTPYGWEKDSFVSEKGQDIEGYYRPEISITVIRSRKRWIAGDQSFPWSAFEEAKAAGNPRGSQQYLVLLKDAEQLGPFVITLKGMAAMSFAGSSTFSATGGLSCLNRTVIAAANAMSKPSKWPTRAFWLTMAAAINAKGEPLFTTVGKGDASSQVILPVPVGLPDKAADVALDDFYIGDEVLELTNQLYIEAEPWAKAWERFDSKTERHSNGNGKVEAAVKMDEAELAEAGL